MDCFRSGLDGPLEPSGFEAELADRLGGAELGLPKKSSPNKELSGFDCLGEAVRFRGGGRVPGTSVVLGLAGGNGASSPKRSTTGATVFRGVGGG